MLKTISFIDFKNFNIGLHEYYKEKCFKEGKPTRTPNVNLVELSNQVALKLPFVNTLVKTYLFYSKPDIFLMKDTNVKKEYEYLDGYKRAGFCRRVEGMLIARPNKGYDYKTMDINDPNTYSKEEKQTDINIAVNLLEKAYTNAYDIALILSVDKDLIPALKVVSAIGKIVIVAGVEGQIISEEFIECVDMRIKLTDKTFCECAPKRYDETSNEF